MTKDTSNAVAVRQSEPLTLEQQNAASADVVKLITRGDLSKLTPEQLVQVYIARCDALGLDARAQPFEVISFRGQTKLYPKKEAAEQLRKLNGISTTITEETVTPEGILRVRIRGVDREGREDEEVAALFIKGLQGEDLANAYMKVITKAKRRITLSMCGLGSIADVDEDDPRILRRQAVDVDANSIVEVDDEVTDADRMQAQLDREAKQEKRAHAAALKRFHAAGADVGLDHEGCRKFAQQHFPMIESLTELLAADLSVLADAVKDAVKHEHSPNDSLMSASSAAEIVNAETGEIDPQPETEAQILEVEGLPLDNEPDAAALDWIKAAQSLKDLTQVGLKIATNVLGTERVREAFGERQRELKAREEQSQPQQQPVQSGVPSFPGSVVGSAGNDRYSS
jgi:hypothetical protein